MSSYYPMIALEHPHMCHLRAFRLWVAWQPSRPACVRIISADVLLPLPSSSAVRPRPPSGPRLFPVECMHITCVLRASCPLANLPLGYHPELPPMDAVPWQANVCLLNLYLHLTARGGTVPPNNPKYRLRCAYTSFRPHMMASSEHAYPPK